ncbi:MAG: ABC transporter ATP-binding protein, partial [Fusobacteriaceae bacterium]
YTAREILEMGRFPYEKSSLDSDVGYEIIEKFTKLFNIEKLLSKPINEMSSGERQRILFIKALVQDTEFILLDEATANLDLFHTYNLLEELRREMLGSNKGVIAVFHDINLAATYCDEIIMLREGKIVVSGLKDEILSPKNIEDVFSVQSKILNCDGEKIIFSYLDK